MAFADFIRENARELVGLVAALVAWLAARFYDLELDTGALNEALFALVAYLVGRNVRGAGERVEDRKRLRSRDDDPPSDAGTPPRGDSTHVSSTSWVSTAVVLVAVSAVALGGCGAPQHDVSVSAETSLEVGAVSFVATLDDQGVATEGLRDALVDAALSVDPDAGTPEEVIDALLSSDVRFRFAGQATWRDLVAVVEIVCDPADREALGALCVLVADLPAGFQFRIPNAADP